MSDQEKSIKEIEKALAESEERARQLDRKIEEAEAKHPPPPDHANEGGVI